MFRQLAIVALVGQLCVTATFSNNYQEEVKLDDNVRAAVEKAVPQLQKHIDSGSRFELLKVKRIRRKGTPLSNKNEVDGDFWIDLSLREVTHSAKKGFASTVQCGVQMRVSGAHDRGKMTDAFCEPVLPPREIAPGLASHHGRRLRLSRARLQSLFAAFVAEHGRRYASSAEYARRRRVFGENLRHAARFQRLERGTAVYGVTKFSDMTVEEWRATALGLDTSRGRPIPEAPWRQAAAVPEFAEMPTRFDWREKGAVTGVKDQGQCGSCWAFSVTGNVEGQYYLKHKELLSFSEQELVDCDTDDHGCQGGLPDQAYKFIEFLGGLEEEKDYPYEAKNDVCRLNRTDLKVKLSGSLDLPKNEADIQKWLYANGPVSIGVNANPLMFYRGGVIDVWSFLCRASGIDHGVLLVGFGETTNYYNKTVPYWIVKNSWGADWGEKGYFRLFRGSDECGIQDMASSSVVA